MPSLRSFPFSMTSLYFCLKKTYRPKRIWVIWWLISCLFHFDCFTGKNQFILDSRFKSDQISLFFVCPIILTTKLCFFCHRYLRDNRAYYRDFYITLHLYWLHAALQPFMVDFSWFWNVWLIVFWTIILLHILHFTSYFLPTYECIKYKLFEKQKKTLIFKHDYAMYFTLDPLTLATVDTVIVATIALSSYFRRKNGVTLPLNVFF